MQVNRNTIQRQMVLAAVRKLHHPSAEEIYHYIIKKHPSISKATVYRNLNLLSEQDEIVRVEVPNAPDRFDKVLASHYHIRCRQCGGVSDVSMEYLEDLNDSITDNHGFIIEGHQIMFQGLCPLCIKN